MEYDRPTPEEFKPKDRTAEDEAIEAQKRAEAARVKKIEKALGKKVKKQEGEEAKPKAEKVEKDVESADKPSAQTKTEAEATDKKPKDQPAAETLEQRPPADEAFEEFEASAPTEAVEYDAGSDEYLARVEGAKTRQAFAHTVTDFVTRVRSDEETAPDLGEPTLHKENIKDLVDAEEKSEAAEEVLEEAIQEAVEFAEFPLEGETIIPLQRQAPKAEKIFASSEKKSDSSAAPDATSDMVAESSADGWAPVGPVHEAFNRQLEMQDLKERTRKAERKAKKAKRASKAAIATAAVGGFVGLRARSEVREQGETIGSLQEAAARTDETVQTQAKKLEQQQKKLDRLEHVQVPQATAAEAKANPQEHRHYVQEVAGFAQESAADTVELAKEVRQETARVAAVEPIPERQAAPTHTFERPKIQTPEVASAAVISEKVAEAKDQKTVEQAEEFALAERQTETEEKKTVIEKTADKKPETGPKPTVQVEHADQTERNFGRNDMPGALGGGGGGGGADTSGSSGGPVGFGSDVYGSMLAHDEDQKKSPVAKVVEEHQTAVFGGAMLLMVCLLILAAIIFVG